MPELWLDHGSRGCLLFLSELWGHERLRLIVNHTYVIDRTVNTLALVIPLSA